MPVQKILNEFSLKKNKIQLKLKQCGPHNVKQF